LTRFSRYIVPLRHGKGVAIVPYPHVASDIKDRRLLAPFGFFTGQGGYHFYCRPLHKDLPRYRKLQKWLSETGAPFRG
jgi:DNA-binding transcriptional LysR family regulator